MDEHEKELLAPFLKRTPGLNTVDRLFLDGAKKALAEAGCDALAFLAANPGMSKIELAKRLNRGASALGLVMAIYAEAAQKEIVRETAKDMLIRILCAEYPEGWFIEEKIGAHVRLGSWDYELANYVQDPQVGIYAEAILKDIAIDHPPPAGWKPQPQSDPLIDELFVRYWPT